jgi:A/G-specific adenine glycosylase
MVRHDDRLSIFLIPVLPQIHRVAHNREMLVPNARTQKQNPAPDLPPSAPTSALLDWYDKHARTLPWRTTGGRRADPYAVWLSEIMLQQTTVEAVKPYFARFLARWPDVAALAAAEEAELLTAWAGLGYYARARNLHACAKVIMAEHGGVFPNYEAGLRSLPGIGAYTAAAIAAIAFGERALVVDGNVERVITRLYAIATPLPKAKAEIRARLDPLTPEHRPGDFAQAMMDLGATICTPRNPLCSLCPLRPFCAAQKAGTMLDFPVKPAKKPRPVRFGTAFVVRDSSDALLLRTRPAKGLLGGMSEVPTSPWEEAGATSPFKPPLESSWQVLNAPVIHVFTHFELRLGVQVARVPAGTIAPFGMRWVGNAALAGEPLPTLMRKVIAAATPPMQNS